MARREPTPADQYRHALEDVATNLHLLAGHVPVLGMANADDRVAAAVAVHDEVLRTVAQLGLGPLLRAAIRADHPEVVQQ